MTVLFRDDFEGPTLDLTKWQPNWFGNGNTQITKPVNGAEHAAYDPAQVHVRNGKLHLRLAHRSVLAADGRTYPDATGCVTTLRSFATPADNYRVAARIHLEGTDKTLYNWPALWTDGLGHWPDDGESDILEGLSDKAAWHYHSPSGAPGGSVPMGRGWHDFEEHVANGEVTYFYDGKEMGTLAAVRKPHFLIIANQSGSYGGAYMECDMRVDWVEVSTL